MAEIDSLTTKDRLAVSITSIGAVGLLPYMLIIPAVLFKWGWYAELLDEVYQSLGSILFGVLVFFAFLLFATMLTAAWGEHRELSARKKRLREAIEPQYLNRLVKALTGRFFLYLRNFQREEFTEQEYKTIIGSNAVEITQHYRREREPDAMLLKILTAHVNVVGIGNALDPEPFGDVITLFAWNDSWRKVFYELCESAAGAYFYVTSITPSIKHELGQISKETYAAKVFVFTPKQDIEELVKSYGVQNVVCDSRLIDDDLYKDDLGKDEYRIGGSQARNAANDWAQKKLEIIENLRGVFKREECQQLFNYGLVNKALDSIEEESLKELSNVSVFKVIDWDSPTTKNLIAEARAQGCELLELGSSDAHRNYKLPCGHEQEITTARMRNGSFRCHSCMDVDLTNDDRD